MGVECGLLFLSVVDVFVFAVALVIPLGHAGEEAERSVGDTMQVSAVPRKEPVVPSVTSNDAEFLLKAKVRLILGGVTCAANHNMVFFTLNWNQQGAAFSHAKMIAG